MIFATGAEFATYSGLDAPTDIDRLLARASELIAANVFAPYSIEDDGSFTEDDVADAVRDATCGQIEWWLQTGDEVEATVRFKTPGIGGLNVSTTGIRLAPRAADALDRAGLRAVMSS